MSSFSKEMISALATELAEYYEKEYICYCCSEIACDYLRAHIKVCLQNDDRTALKRKNILLFIENSQTRFLDQIKKGQK